MNTGREPKLNANFNQADFNEPCALVFVTFFELEIFHEPQ
jgi:hypothetical protein